MHDGRADKKVAELRQHAKDKDIIIDQQYTEIADLRDEVLRLRNGLRMLLVAESWEEQPGPVLVEYVNQLLAQFERPFTCEDEESEL